MWFVLLLGAALTIGWAVLSAGRAGTFLVQAAVVASVAAMVTSALLLVGSWITRSRTRGKHHADRDGAHARDHRGGGRRPSGRGDSSLHSYGRSAAGSSSLDRPRLEQADAGGTRGSVTLTTVGIHHVDLAVSDVERSLAFYLGLLGPLGWEEAVRYPTYRGTEEVVYLEDRATGSMLGIRPADGGSHRYYEVGIEHIAFELRAETK